MKSQQRHNLATGQPVTEWGTSVNRHSNADSKGYNRQRAAVAKGLIEGHHFGITGASFGLFAANVFGSAVMMLESTTHSCLVISDRPSSVTVSHLMDVLDDPISWRRNHCRAAARQPNVRCAVTAKWSPLAHDQTGTEVRDHHTHTHTHTQTDCHDVIISVIVSSSFVRVD